MITILTDPIPALTNYYKEKLMVGVRPVIRMFDKKLPLVQPLYGGHFAVTRSLVEGLVKNKIEFNYNPRRVSDCANIVLVLAGIKMLKQAIELKKSGVIRKLFAGPNVMLAPQHHLHEIDFNSIDAYIVNSAWTRDLYIADCAALQNKTIVWPAGVDEEFWQPGTDSGAQKKRKVILYKKDAEPDLYLDALSYLCSNGFNVSEIIYGNYSTESYKALLNDACLLIYFNTHESQGIALLEAWAMDVPTLVWETGYHFAGDKKVPSSSAPYLTADTGMFFSNLETCVKYIHQVFSGPAKFAPRKWVLNNLTDQKAAKNLMDEIVVF